MKRGHRTVHRWLWPLLALALLVGVASAYVWREPPGEKVQIESTERPV